MASDATPSRAIPVGTNNDFLLGQVVDRMQTLSETTGRLSEEQISQGKRLVALPASVAASVTAALNPRLDNIETRVSALERWRWYTAGGLAVIVFTIGAAESFRVLNNPPIHVAKEQTK